MTPTADRHVFTGALEGSDARVAIIASGEGMVGYVCGGPTTFATLSHMGVATKPGDSTFTLTL